MNVDLCTLSTTTIYNALSAMAPDTNVLPSLEERNEPSTGPLPQPNADHNANIHRTATSKGKAPVLLTQYLPLILGSIVLRKVSHNHSSAKMTTLSAWSLGWVLGQSSLPSALFSAFSSGPMTGKVHGIPCWQGRAYDGVGACVAGVLDQQNCRWGGIAWVFA